MKIKYLLCFFSFFVLVCVAKGQERDAYLDITNGNQKAVKKLFFEDKNILQHILESVTDVSQLGSLIKKSISQLDTSNLLQSNYPQRTKKRQALALGIYSVDLGYCNLYDLNRTQQIYLLAIENLAKELQIKQYIDFDKIKKISLTGNHVDSLMLETQQSYDKITMTDKAVERQYEYLLILLGGFIEANYQTLLMYEKLQKSKTDIAILKQWKDKIGEQKLTLEQIIVVLNFFTPYKTKQHLKNDLQKLQTIYQKVQIAIPHVPPMFKLVNNEWVASNEIIYYITISDSTISKISEQIGQIRSKIIR